MQPQVEITLEAGPQSSISKLPVFFHPGGFHRMVLRNLTTSPGIIPSLIALLSRIPSYKGANSRHALATYILGWQFRVAVLWSYHKGLWFHISWLEKCVPDVAAAQKPTENPADHLEKNNFGMLQSAFGLSTNPNTALCFRQIMGKVANTYHVSNPLLILDDIRVL